MDNYIKLSRELMEWEWYGNINTCRLFIHMLLKANWKDCRFEGKTIGRGSFISSVGKLSEETALTEREVRTAITHLKLTGELTSKSTNKYTVFTVVNYDLYQSCDKQNDKQETSKRQTNDKLTTTIEERKERKEENNIVATPPGPEPATVAFPADSFEIRCVDMLIDSCLKSFPNSKVPGTLTEKQKWAVEIDRMKRLDGRTEEEILQALNYASADPFWQTNIRSANKLREKFETLIVQSRKRGKAKDFNNFHQNQYNFEELERDLLSN